MSLENARQKPSAPVTPKPRCTARPSHRGLHLVPAAEVRRRASARMLQLQRERATTRRQSTLEGTYLALALSTAVFLLLTSF